MGRPARACLGPRLAGSAGLGRRRVGGEIVRGGCVLSDPDPRPLPPLPPGAGAGTRGRAPGKGDSEIQRMSSAQAPRRSRRSSHSSRRAGCGMLDPTLTRSMENGLGVRQPGPILVLHQACPLALVKRTQVRRPYAPRIRYPLVTPHTACSSGTQGPGPTRGHQGSRRHRLLVRLPAPVPSPCLEYACLLGSGRASAE